MKTFYNTLCLSLISKVAFASTIKLKKTATDDLFSTFTDKMQNFTDFFTGEFAAAAIILSSVAALVLWNAGPQSPMVARTFKVAASGLILFNIGFLISYLGY